MNCEISIMEYLLTLQNFRENCISIIPLVLSFISELVCIVGPVVPIVLFFCVDKRLGSRVCFVFTVSDTVTNVIKLGLCVKRPWLRDSRLYPAKAIEQTATGYSMPSGHTSAAASIYGSMAQWLRKRAATIICIFLILLTAFARNFLGAHTLEDVLVALGLTLLVGLVVQFIFVRMEKNPKLDVVVLVSGLVLCTIACLYIGLKEYPDDLMADGTYLYVKMQKDGFSSLGMMIAWLIAWFVERRWINFSIEGSVKTRIIRGLIAAVIFCLFFFVITKLAFLKADPRVYYFFKRFISVIVTIGVYPWLIKLYQNKKSGLKKQ